MVTATELGRPEFALHWHEAVAIVAETAAILLDRGINSVPDPASVVLSPDGRLHLLDVGDAPPTPAPGRRLGSMLDVLLASSACPPELRRLTDESLADPPAFATIEEFANALAFFERPGRDELLAGVAARASEAALEARANTELERLEARTRDVKRKIVPRPDEKAPHGNRKHMALLFAGSLIVSIAAGAILGLRAIDSEARERGAPALTDRVRARVDRIAARGLEAVGLRTPAPPAATPVAEVKPPAVAPKPSRRAPQPAPPTISVKDLTGGHVVALHSSVAPEAPAPVVHDEAVYAADAEDVEPAVLTRPHLPSRPPDQTTAEDEIGFLEIIVSASGAVEQVRLISTTNRFQDRMIVAAAKAWQFAPATKNGLPVRYRTRIRITL